MKKEKKLSIIIPMYNGKKRIKKCIQSIFAQTYPNLELILIDDGSGDDTYEMARKAVKEAEKAQREAGTSQGEAAAGRTIEVRLPAPGKPRGCLYPQLRYLPCLRRVRYVRGPG